MAAASANNTTAYIAAKKTADLSCVGFSCSGIRLGSLRTRYQTQREGAIVKSIRISTGGAAEARNSGATTAISTNTRMNTIVEAIMITIAGTRKSAERALACRA